MRHFQTLGVLACAALIGAVSCGDPESNTYARRVESVGELIGGPGAIGEVGDYLIGNQKIRVILQNQGWSRGFGIFGGGIIDADIVRPGTQGDFGRGNGKDNFGEFFPALFLQAFDVASRRQRDENGDLVELPAVEVINDGTNGEPALIRTRAKAGDFITLASIIGEEITKDATSVVFETDYLIKPGARHIEITGRLTNRGSSAAKLDGEGLAGLLSTIGGSPIESLPIPLGDVLLFGAGNAPFAPGGITDPFGDGEEVRAAGYDLRFAVEDAYTLGVSLPSLPGLVTDFLASSGSDVSYGFAIAESDANYPYSNRDLFAVDPKIDVNKSSLLVPFLFSAFTGAYHTTAPARIEAKETFEWTKYFIVGDGTVQSVLDELNKIRGVETGEFWAEVKDELTGHALHGAHIVIFDEIGMAVTSTEIRDDGRFVVRLPAGKYHWVVREEGRFAYPEKASRLGELNQFEIVETGDGLKGGYKVIRVPSGSRLTVDIRDVNGQPIPGKVSVVGSYEVSETCRTCTELDCSVVCDPRNYLFDKTIGEGRRMSDLSWKKQQDGQYIEHIMMAGVDGVVSEPIRPGTYDVYVTRGMEYDAVIIEDVVLGAGSNERLTATLERVVDTKDWVSADFHIHGRGSLDSSVKEHDRVVSAAAEGLEVMVSTDHNYIVDYSPFVVSEGLQDFVTSVVGVEMSSLEMGHFNAFPLAYDAGWSSHFPYVSTCYEPNAAKVNQTSFDWVECSPKQIFSNLRELGAYGPSKTIVQVNHPRDSILGYFDQYYVHPYTGIPEENPSGDNYGSLVSLGIRSNSASGQFEAESFSADFDAVEVFNGKRLDSLFSFRMPERDAFPDSWTEEMIDAFIAKKQDACEGGHIENGPGRLIIEKGGHVSNPGVIDDWMNLLNTGARPTATGNSDSHSLEEELGSPRNYVWVGPDADGKRRDNQIGDITDLDIVEGVKNNQVILTNGPFVNISVLTPNAAGGDDIVWRIGETVDYAAPNTCRSVSILVELFSANWVDIDFVDLYANGRRIRTFEIPEGADDSWSEKVTEMEYQADGCTVDGAELGSLVPLTFAQDTWVVAVARGSQNLFPYVAGAEDPPSNITAALTGILGSSGVDLSSFGGTGDGVTSPEQLQAARPFAMTNPIWLNIDAQGPFDPPGNDPGPGPTPDVDCPDKKSGVHSLFDGHKHSRRGRFYERTDIRRILDGAHSH